MAKRNRWIKPRSFPEALPDKRGEDWRVRTIGQMLGFTDFDNRVMTVPDGLQDRAHAIRLHEMAHVALTPQTSLKTLAGRHQVDLESLQAAEDGRLNLAVSRLQELPRPHRQAYADGIIARTEEGQDVLAKQIHGQFVDQPIETTITMARAMISTLYTIDVEMLKIAWGQAMRAERGGGEAAVGMMLKILAAADEIFQRDLYRQSEVPPFRRAVEVAALLDQLQEQLEQREKEREAKRQRQRQNGLSLEKRRELQQQHEKSDELMKDWWKKDNRPKILAPPKVGGACAWGTMTIERFPLEDDQELRRRYRKMMHVDAGCAVGDISRVLTDQRVFREARPVIAGTILIDCSGSMGISAHEVRALVLESPALTVALYSGQSSEGYLRIVAERGRCCRKESAYVMPGGNIVDGPALWWLAHQKEPRIWVSDGQVTGRSECQTQDLMADAMRLQALARVTRVSLLRFALPMMNEVLREMGRRHSTSPSR